MTIASEYTGARVLIVEDDATIQRLAREVLDADGLIVESCVRGDEALAAVERFHPHVLVLDLELPGVDGRELCQRLRAAPDTSDLPILMMTSYDSAEDRVRGFELGADDYLPKPVAYRELALRVQALLRRTMPRTRALPAAGSLELGPLRIDLERRELWLNEAPIDLTSTEYRLLAYLALKRGRVVDRQELLEEVWGTSGALSTRRVDTYVQRLRAKLGAAGKLLKTRRGHGYCLELPAGD